MPYDLQTIKSPRLTGFALGAAAALLDSPATRGLLVPRMLRETGVARFRAASFAEPPTPAPVLPLPSDTRRGRRPLDLEAVAGAAPVPPGFRFESIVNYAIAYREGTSTPEQVAYKVIEALKQCDVGSPPLRAMIASNEEKILAQAFLSAQRFREHQPLGPLDGVPIAVKDELDVVPYPTTVGTRFMRQIATEDATVVARLRAAGAIIIGKANMHEIGIDTSGFNPHHGTPRNPYNLGHYTGGSSSGSAAAVAAGLCPVAVGADGGGSIRIPASLCGIAGLKPTWGRVSEFGAAPLCWSVAHIGPLGATVRDVALAYAVMAGPDPKDPNSLNQPPVRLDGLGDMNLSGVRLGIYTPWFEHSSAEVLTRCLELVDELKAYGATVVEIEIPDLEWGRVAHAITIVSEMVTAMEPYDAEHRQDLGLGVRLNLALARQLNNRDYVKAQQVRTLLTQHFQRVFESVDAVVTPTTAITSPAIARDVFPRGESNLDTTSAMMRYVFPSNLTGHPALSVPAGYDSAGLPIGLQLIGRPWEEHMLLRIGEVVEQRVDRLPPQLHYSLLPMVDGNEIASPQPAAAAGIK